MNSSDTPAVKTPRPRSEPRQSFGVLELATACAALVIVLGSAVSLARFVRGQDSAAAFHEQLLVLDRQLNEHGVPDGLVDFAPGGTAAEEQALPDVVRAAARANADSWMKPLDLDAAWTVDPWGSPVVLIEGRHPQLGMGPRLAPFFMSAGPDGRYFTVIDNIYGYDTYLPHVVRASTRPAGGHGE